MALTAPLARSRDSDDADSSASADDTNGDQVESLVSGRAKRITAGNRISSLRNEGDDELELLFAEEDGEDDVDFGADDSDGASDIPMDSSTDDEEDDAGKEPDEWAGERELQKQTKAERGKKRKAHDVFKRVPGGVRKKLMMNPTSKTALPQTPATRPRKKSERVSWVRAPEDGPVRSSTRKQTVQNKQSVHQRIVESERRRVQLIQVMEEAAKRKEASKPKLLTQAERLEEAARTEERNAKSLNRWEATEKKRSDEQKAKLEALQNRHLSGPVITWWSGIARWVNGKLTQVGCRDAKGAPPRDGAVDSGGVVHQNPSDHTVVSSGSAAPPKAGDSPSKPIPNSSLAAGPGSDSRADGFPSADSIPGEPRQSHAIHPAQLLHSRRGVLANPRDSEAPPPRRPSNPVAVRGSEPLPADGPRGDLPTAMIEHSARNVIIFDNIDVDDVRLPALQNHPLLKRRNGKPARKCTSCPPRDSCRHCSTHAMWQGLCRSCAPSPRNRLDFAILEPAWLTRTHMLTRRFNGSRRGGTAGAPCWGVMSARSPAALEAFPIDFDPRQRRASTALYRDKAAVHLDQVCIRVNLYRSGSWWVALFHVSKERLTMWSLIQSVSTCHSIRHDYVFFRTRHCQSVLANLMDDMGSV